MRCFCLLPFFHPQKKKLGARTVPGPVLYFRSSDEEPVCFPPTKSQVAALSLHHHKASKRHCLHRHLPKSACANNNNNNVLQTSATQLSIASTIPGV